MDRAGGARRATRPVQRGAPTPPWFVAAVTFVTIIRAAAFRSLPGLLIEPLNEDCVR